MSSQAININILGKVTRINCPKGQEEPLLKAANDLNNRLKKMSSNSKVEDLEKLLTIAALNVCYELQMVKKTNQEQKYTLIGRIERLNDILDDTLDSPSQ